MDSFKKIAGALAVIAIISEAILLLIGTPGHSLHNGRAVGEALGAAIGIFVAISIPAGIIYAIKRRRVCAEACVEPAIISGIFFGIVWTVMMWKGAPVSGEMHPLSQRQAPIADHWRNGGGAADDAFRDLFSRRQ